MSLFQKSVEKKYLNGLDPALIDKKFNDFQSYFGNVEIQENIRNSKEEEFQEGFIRELFVNILNYTLKPKPEFNIVLEKKNIDDSKKADGAIIKNDDVTAVIELKSTSTTDLDTVETQAFGYKNHHPKCVYIITSNFEKIRFYIQNAVDYLEFDLFNLSIEQFSLLWLCLSKDNILSDLPLRIKESSVLQEENVTKQLYADYSKFREAIFENIVKNNPDKNELLLFKKTQKLLDRFLFIFFAEDRLLLPPNSISEIIIQWITLKEDLDAYVPLYERFKKYFSYMNTGFKGKKYDIFPYNGGLFLSDEVLDNISIDDHILHEHTLKLSAYDFETDVDVNILGHIFEHSLAEIENVQAKLRGEQIDKQKTKRKKDGIFYTPKYITKYIVENTVGKLCEEKRNELEIIDEEYVKGRKNRKKATIKSLDEKLNTYRNWLLCLTILDPACGSGAFLNQALEFLINEHKKIDELQAQLFGGGIVFSDITNEILEKNIYGVDLNEESVEIAKLSLWLRTAQKGRKLNTLSNNIKCGNSLIDDPKVAGEKAFDWNKEFSQIFRKKKKKAWHVTTAIHNSRYSQRMFDYNIKTDEATWLSEKDEIIITEIIAEIVKKDNLNVVEYNTCGDHLHLLLICEEEELTKIVGKIKGKSSRLYHNNKGINPLVQKKGEKSISLWTQKFGKSEIKTENYLNNTIDYIRNNRIKHKLPDNKGINPIIQQMCCSVEHAFRIEYNGGFDVVIGNPPYVRPHNIKDNEKVFLWDKYIVASQKTDLYAFFTEKGALITKKNGFLGFIMPKTWMSIHSFFMLRKFLLENYHIKKIGLLPKKVFDDAIVETAIIIIENNKNFNEIEFIDITENKIIKYEKQSNIQSTKNLNINENIQKQIKDYKYLGDICEIIVGIATGDDKKYCRFEKLTDIDKRAIRGANISRYNINYKGEYLWYDTQEMINDSNLKPKSTLKGSGLLCSPKKPSDFEIPEKIVMQRISKKIIASIDTEQFYAHTSVVIIKSDGNSLFRTKYILAVLNSAYINYWLKTNSSNVSINVGTVKNIPIKNLSKERQVIYENKVNLMLLLNQQLQEKKNKFLNRTKDNFEIEKINKKLDAFYDYDFKIFVAELKKQKIKLSLIQQDEWEEYFNTYKNEINQLQDEINATDKEIDQMVYELYGLTEEEIGIVEGS
jgi:REP element-mobilizing transposase RayT/type I restriction-modification system DNA methylase subunit